MILSFQTTCFLFSVFPDTVEMMVFTHSLRLQATCEMTSHDIPSRVTDFFTKVVVKSANMASSEHTIPRFSVEVDGSLNHSLVINSSVARISCDFLQQYVQLVHRRSHASNMDGEPHVLYNRKIAQERESPIIRDGEATEALCTVIDSGRISSNCGASSRDDQSQQPVNDSERRNLISEVNKEVDAPLQGSQDYLLRAPSNRVIKGNSALMIATLGYQILQYPQLAELCWATSKLKEGPCADVSGPWKVWPFNSCIIHPNDSVDKAASPSISRNVKNKEISGVVRGLMAVGLLAYRGSYASVREVSSQVRTVLELLVGLISDKIQKGKDRYRYFRILSQVAYLEDMVNTWAYTFLRYYSESMMESFRSI